MPRFSSAARNRGVDRSRNVGENAPSDGGLVMDGANGGIGLAVRRLELRHDRLQRDGGESEGEVHFAFSLLSVRRKGGRGKRFVRDRSG